MYIDFHQELVLLKLLRLFQHPTMRQILDATIQIGCVVIDRARIQLRICKS